ncbi:MAG TPA: magnesium chelatase domain-containing protein, partial [Trueperaceae bacterium]|nr:magnesium chelatase domain-containing protein [Trueperaceae bacterium]
MFAAVTSATIQGVEALEVRVEAFVSGGLPNFTIVGLPGAAVQESRERVRANLKLLGLPLPPSRILVNLAPADVRKEGPALDLPIALALLAADRRLPARALEGLVAFGELALDGGLRPVRGAVAIALMSAGLGAAAGSVGRILAPAANAARGSSTTTGSAPRMRR